MKDLLFVTGAAGFIGCNFVRLALKSGYRVLGLDVLTYAGHRENLEDLPHHENFELWIGDIRDAGLVAELLQSRKPTALLNFAAESHVDRSIEKPLDFVDTNVMGTANLLAGALVYWKSLEGAAKENFRYLQVSTDEVFGSLGETGKFSETTPLDPSSPYSSSKAAGDMLVKAWGHTFGLPTIITRCSNNYGPYQYPEKLIPHLVQCALQGKTLPVYGDGSNIRDWIHVEDHCAGILLALTKGNPGDTFCLGGNSEVRNIEVAQAICNHLDELRPLGNGSRYSRQIEFVTDRPGHDYRYAIDDNRAAKELGFTRKHNFGTGLRATIEWYLAHEDWAARVLGK